MCAQNSSLLVNFTAKMTEAMTVAARHQASNTTNMLHRRGHRIVVTLILPSKKKHFNLFDRWLYLFLLSFSPKE